MIGRLALAQLRANKTHSAWMGALLTLLVAILTATVVMGATQARLAQDEGRVNGWGQEYSGAPLIATGDGSASEKAYSLDEVTQAVLGATGHHAMAVASSDLYRGPVAPNGLPTGGAWPVVATIGEGAWLPLAEGRAPTERGEIVLAADVARAEGVGIGDDVTAAAADYGPDGAAWREYTFHVVGIAASRSLPGFDLWAPAGYLSWADVEDPDGLFATRWTLPSGEEQTQWGVRLAWTGHVPELDPMGGQWGLATANFALPEATIAWFGAAAMLFASMIVMAFAVGRSQASSRAQWIATVRTMGARRGAIAAAAAAETLILAAAAVVVGMILGVGLAQGWLTLARAIVREPLGLAVVSLHWAIVPVAVASALVAALVVAAVPAFWASRVAPTAALKPINDLTEAEISRRVPFVWAAVPLAIGVALVWLGNSPSVPLYLVVILGWIATVVGAFVLVLEVLRRLIPLVGRALARLRSPALLSAGDELAARPRQAVAPALLIALGLPLVALWAARDAISTASWWYPPSLSDTVDTGFWHQVRTDLTSSNAVATVVAAAVAVQIVAAAISASHRAAVGAEEAARAAMGLTPRQQAVSWWWLQWIPQVLGAIVGLVAAAVLVWWITVLDPPSFGNGSGESLAGSVVIFAVVCAAVAAVGAVALGALAAALTARGRRGTRVAR